MCDNVTVTDDLDSVTFGVVISFCLGCGMRDTVPQTWDGLNTLVQCCWVYGAGSRSWWNRKVLKATENLTVWMENGSVGVFLQWSEWSQKCFKFSHLYMIIHWHLGKVLSLLNSAEEFRIFLSLWHFVTSAVIDSYSNLFITLCLFLSLSALIHLCLFRSAVCSVVLSCFSLICGFCFMLCPLLQVVILFL